MSPEFMRSFRHNIDMREEEQAFAIAGTAAGGDDIGSIGVV